MAENLLQGKGFRVEEKVPTDGIMGIYTLIADKETFGEDAGSYRVLSREMAELRLAEIPAIIIKLNETSKVGTFVKSMVYHCDSAAGVGRAYGAEPHRHGDGAAEWGRALL